MKDENYSLENYKLRERILELESIISCFDDIVFVVSSDGTILDSWTLQPQELFFDRDRILNIPIEDLFPEEFASTMVDILEKTIRTKKSHQIIYQSPVEAFKGSWFRLKTRFMENFPGKVMVVISNITKEIELQYEVEMEEEKFNQAFMHSSIGMLLLDGRMRLVEQNRALLEMLGMEDEKTFRHKRFSDYIHQDHIKELMVAVTDLRLGIVHKAVVETRVCTKNGKYLWCLISFSSVKDQDGQVTYFICQIQDLSDFKEIEKKLKFQNSALEKINFELEIKIKQLETINQVLAHDLRSPLANIEMITEQLKTGTKSRQDRKYLDMILLSGNKFKNHLGRMIDFLESLDSLDHKFKWNEVNSIFKDSVNELEKQIKCSGFNIIKQSQRTMFFFPMKYLKTLFKYVILCSIKETGSENRASLLFNESEKTLKLHIKSNNQSEMDPYNYNVAAEKLKEVMTVDFFIAKHQVLSVGGSIKFLQPDSQNYILVIKMPDNYVA